MKEIERLATLYRIDEYEAACMVSTIFDPVAPKGSHVDYNKLTYAFMKQDKYFSKANSISSKVESDVPETGLGEKIYLMDSCTPKEYLSYKQGGVQPVTTDLYVVNSISEKFKFPNGVINALIDYVLKTSDNILSKAKCERYASGMAREGINTTRDAMTYFLKLHKAQKRAQNKQKEENGESLKTTSKEKQQELNNLMNELEILHNK